MWLDRPVFPNWERELSPNALGHAFCVINSLLSYRAGGGTSIEKACLKLKVTGGRVSSQYISLVPCTVLVPSRWLINICWKDSFCMFYMNNSLYLVICIILLLYPDWGVLVNWCILYINYQFSKNLINTSNAEATLTI